MPPAFVPSRPKRPKIVSHKIFNAWFRSIFFAGEETIITLPGAYHKLARFKAPVVAEILGYQKRPGLFGVLRGALQQDSEGLFVYPFVPDADFFVRCHP